MASRRRPPARHQPPLRQRSRHPASIRGPPATCPALQAPASPSTFFTAAPPPPASCQVSTEAGWAQKGASPPFSAFPLPKLPPSPLQPYPPMRAPRGRAHLAIHPRGAQVCAEPARPLYCLSRTAALRAPGAGGEEAAGGVGGAPGRAGRGRRNKARRAPGGTRRAAQAGGGEARPGPARHAAPSPGRLPGGAGQRSAAPSPQPAAGAAARRARLPLSSVFVFLIAGISFVIYLPGARWGCVKSRESADVKGWRAAAPRPVPGPLGGAWTLSTGTPQPPPLGAPWPCHGSSWACREDR